MSNKILSNAQMTRRDEFYTRLVDIEREIGHYDPQLFYNKTVFCNCDNPAKSEFWRYFHLNFTRLHLKKLLAYGLSGLAKAYAGGSMAKDADPKIGKRIQLKGSGDFRSRESVFLLKRSDIVVTNPPFSLFREYIAQLIKYQKHFIVWGNNNAISYKDIFPLIKDNKMWLGCTANKTCYFKIPADYPKYDSAFTKKMHDGSRYAKVPAISTFTNLDTGKRHRYIKTGYRYGDKSRLYPDLYPMYDNCRAIEVSRVSQLPMDYTGLMGVPITFLSKYDPQQFKIVGADYDFAGPVRAGDRSRHHPQRFYVNGKRKYARILIKKK